jgi:hypothetical protein
MAMTSQRRAPESTATERLPHAVRRSRSLLRLPDPSRCRRCRPLSRHLRKLVREWHRLARVRGGCRGCRWLPGTSGASS